MNFTCSKCNKELSSKQSLKRHEEKCNGLDKLQCELCHKKFAQLKNKYKHKKLKVCERNGTIIDNSVNSHNDNSIHIDRSTINININFGQEKVELDNDFIDKCIKQNFTGIIEMIRKIFFSCPKEQFTIKKENKRDEFIDIMEEGKWQKEFKNIVINQVLNKALLPMSKRIVERNIQITEEDDREGRKQLIDEIEPYLITIDILCKKVRQLKKLCYYDPDESLKNKEQRRKRVFKIIDELIYNETKSQS
jgi:hypothetical protein